MHAREREEKGHSEEKSFKLGFKGRPRGEKSADGARKKNPAT